MSDAIITLLKASIIVIILISIIISIVKEYFSQIITLAILAAFVIVPIFAFRHGNIPFAIAWTIGIPLICFICYSIIKFIRYIIEKKRYLEHQKRIRQDIAQNMYWINTNSKPFLRKVVNNLLYKFISEISNNDEANYKFDKGHIPYGRANSFLGFHKSNIYIEDPLYFSCNSSLKQSDFREYGFIITNLGIYSSYQEAINSDKKITYYAHDSKLLFSGLRSVSISKSENNKILWQGIDKNGMTSNGSLYINNCIIIDVLNLCKQIIKSNLSAAMYSHNIYNDINTLKKSIRLPRQQLNNQIDNIPFRPSLNNAAQYANTQSFNNSFGELKNYMNGSRGGGYAAEYANNTWDRFNNKDVINAAQQLNEQGHQIKNGADRIVNGIEIQTKYYKNARESISAAFENGQAKYIRSDGSGKMMQIEVPLDQYDSAIELMQKRIDDGQVPNIEPNESAYEYVKKGAVTYNQALNTALSGTLESLCVDTMSGIVYSKDSGTISGLIIFAYQIWSGKPILEAAKTSLAVSTEIIGKGSMIYLLTMQLTRANIVNPLSYIFKGLDKTFTNTVANTNEVIAQRISSSELAKSPLGRVINLNAIDSKQFVAGSITAAVTFGPDLIKALDGKISLKQLIKNSAVTAAGIAGAAIGNAVVPVVGGIIGGIAVGSFAKKVADELVEDDSIKMFLILKEEFIDCVSLASLSNDELNQVIKQTVGSENLSSILENMHASNNARIYARNNIIMSAVNSVLSQRSRITHKDYIKGLSLLLYN